MEHLSDYGWCFMAGRAVHSLYVGDKGSKNVFLHHCVIGFPLKGEVDHIDGNALNNQRSNLRFVSHQENMQNQKCHRGEKPKASKFIGVHSSNVRYKNKVHVYWQARIRVDGSQKYLGCFKKEEDARKAYEKAFEKIKKGEIELCH